MTAVALAAAAAWVVGAQPQREALKAVGEQLQQEEIDVERLAGEEGSLLSAIESAADDAEAAELALREAQARRGRARRAVAEARAQEAAAQQQADGRLAVLGPRLRAWQRLSPGRRVELLLSAGDAQAAERRAEALRRLLDRNLGEVRSALADLQVAKGRRAEVARLESDLAQRSSEARAAEAEAQSRRSHHGALLAAVREERSLHQKAARELVLAQNRLAQAVAALPPERMESTAFAAAKGRLPAPVDGTIEVGFGPILNPRFHTLTLQKGLDFRAAAGSPVRAVHAGRVVHAGPFAGYGNLLILDHGDGYFSLCAHLATFGPGLNDLVEAGEPIGTVGATGSLKGPYLYFEIRHHGQALDPGTWLTPQLADVSQHP